VSQLIEGGKAMRKFLLFGLLACSVIFSTSCTTFYLGRYVLWNNPTNQDYERFPVRTIANGPTVFEFERDPDAQRQFQDSLEPVRYISGQQSRTEPLETLLQNSETTAFIVIKDDVILYERYFRGYDRDSMNTSASVSKSFVSALVGIAIADGLINGIDDPIGSYLPETEGTRAGTITIRQLLTMSSGFKHTWGTAPWADLVRSYYKPDIRRAALKVRVVEEPDRHYNYNNCHAQLLGIILERVTGGTVSEYLERKIWIPLGMEYPASWCLDSRKNGFEQMMSGMNARAIDYAKFGRLYLNGGTWEGREILPTQWVRRTTEPVPMLEQIPDFYTTEENEVTAAFFAGDGYYSHHWWGYKTGRESCDYFALGLLGQFIYVSPENRVVIVRMAEGWGAVDWWPAVFRELASNLGD
jgi:CubicO group peptidase (beta-lactamase class C family)